MVDTTLTAGMREVRGAHASRVLAKPSRIRELSLERPLLEEPAIRKGSSFPREAVRTVNPETVPLATAL